MKRDVAGLTAKGFDVCVVGGGIFGACAAWDAAQRGLSVALIERDDFASWTSANSFKLIHGGIRYVQHMDVKRVRESSGERRAFLRIAPHVVRPLPFIIPTHGHGMKGKEVLRTGMAIYDAMTFDRNRGLADPARRVPGCRAMSLDETLAFAPGLPRDGLTGAAMMTDGQMMNPPRLILSFVRSAADAGAVVANHVEAVSFERQGDAITGVRFRDRIAGREGTIRAKVTINAAGPYADLLLDAGLEGHATKRQPFSRDACFVVPRVLFDDRRALAVQGATHDPEAHLSRGERHLFFAPWHGYTVVGTWHRVWDGDPNDLHVTTKELQGWLDEINAAYPAFRLTRDDVSRVNCGLVPFGENEEGATHLKYGHRSALIDHARVDAVDGLVTLIGVRLTMGRLEAERAVDLALRKLGRTGPRCRTAQTPVHGGDTTDVEGLRARLHAKAPQDASPDAREALLYNHGTAAFDILAYGEEDPALLTTFGDGAPTFRAEIVHAARCEMAQTLADVLLRRTDLAAGRTPDDAVVEECARIAGRELGWDEVRIRDEVDIWEETVAGRLVDAHAPSSRAWSPAPDPAPVG